MQPTTALLQLSDIAIVCAMIFSFAIMIFARPFAMTFGIVWNHATMIFAFATITFGIVSTMIFAFAATN